MMKIYDVKCNGLDNPTGVANQNLKFTFKIHSTLINVDIGKTKLIIYDREKQVVYEQYTKGFTNSIIWEGELKPHEKYTYQIAVMNHNEEELGVSKTSEFHTAFIDIDQWNSDYILADYELEKTEETPCFIFRKSFLLDEEIAYAKVYATCKGLYEMRLNGNKVSKDYFTPGFTNYHSNLQYQSYEITNELQKGENVVSFICGDGFYKGYVNWNETRNFYGETRQVLMYMDVKLKDGRNVIIKTDETFKWNLAPILVSEIYHGEIYDANKELEGFDQSNYDDSKWKSVVTAKVDTSILISNQNTPVQVYAELEPIAIIKTPKGETLIDMGQNFVGNVEFYVKGEKGDKVHLKHGEMLDKDGNFYCENIAPSKQEIEYTLKGDRNGETYSPRFTFQCFRYVKLLSYPQEVKLENFKGIVLSSFDKQTGFFECSDSRINQLFHNIKWSQISNFIDIPIAGPQRTERVGWTGDAQIFAKTASYNMNTSLFFKKWLNDLNTEQFQNGAIPWVVPNVLRDEEYECLDFFEPKEKDPTSAGWGDAALIIPWELYVQYGEKEILISQYQSMKKYVDFMKNAGDNFYKFDSGFHYGDWFALDAFEGSFVGATPKTYIATAYYAYSTSILIKTAKVLEKKEDIICYEKLYAKIKEMFIKEYFDEADNFIPNTQTACVLALQFKLYDKSEKVLEKLCALLKEKNNHITTGFIGTGYICHVLADMGREDLAYELLFNDDLPSWLYQVSKGATTIWEHWDGFKPDGSFWEPWMNSFNHYAYGCIGDFIYSKLCGIYSDEEKVGYQHFYIKPYITDKLSFAKGRLESVRGEIVSQWYQENRTITMKVKIPIGTTCTIIFPKSNQSNNIEENISNIIKQEDGYCSTTVNHGEYEFIYTI